MLVGSMVFLLCTKNGWRVHLVSLKNPPTYPQTPGPFRAVEPQVLLKLERFPQTTNPNRKSIPQHHSNYFMALVAPSIFGV